jgi:uncharacterized membrane protein YhaH (DUF805 family)
MRTIIVPGGAAMQWMLLPYRRYFDFSGRSRRREFWSFVLFTWLVNIAIVAIFGVRSVYMDFGTQVYADTLTGVGRAIYGVFGLANFIPSLAVWVRRMHDQDRSGWLLLLMFVPILGWFAVLVFLLLAGTPGPNRYGPDPKNPYDIEAFS